MFITKIIETSIDILNPHEIFHPDIESVLLQKLKAKYINKCYLSMYIMEIVKIIRRSSIKMVNNRLDGGAFVDIQFEVGGQVFVKNEILHGCQIVDIHDKTITAENQYAGIMLQQEPTGNIFKILKVGYKIPVIVVSVRYIPNKNKVSIIGMPFIPIVHENEYYNITDGLSVDEMQKINMFREEIKREESLHEAIKKSKSYELFQDIMYPYKTRQKFAIGKVGETMSSVTFDKLDNASGIIVYPEEEKGNKIVYVAKNSTMASLNVSLYTVMSNIFTKYLLYLFALRGFVETYPTPESIQEILIYWKLCKGAKV